MQMQPSGWREDEEGGEMERIQGLAMRCAAMVDFVRLVVGGERERRESEEREILPSQ